MEKSGTGNIVVCIQNLLVGFLFFYCLWSPTAKNLCFLELPTKDLTFNHKFFELFQFYEHQIWSSFVDCNVVRSS